MQMVSLHALKGAVCDQVVEGEGGGSHVMPKTGVVTTQRHSITTFT